MSTVMVTNMPFWSERIGVPRSLAVEFPFGHIIGMPGDPAMQDRVIQHALRVLEGASEPGVIEHLQEKWPEALEQARRRSEPEVPPPVAAQMGRHIGKFLMGMRRGA